MSQFGSDQPLRTVVLPDGCTLRLGVGCDGMSLFAAKSSPIYGAASG